MELPMVLLAIIGIASGPITFGIKDSKHVMDYTDPKE